MNTPRQKSDLLTNIETLWQDAAHSADDQAQSTFQRISNLMQDAMATEIVANDMQPLPNATADATIDASMDAFSREQSHEPSSTLDELASLVEDAATSGHDQSTAPPPFEDAKARMDSVAQLKPPHQDSFNSGTPEYAFGAAFTDLVRHVVRDYIHNEVEGVIKNAISSELDSYFKAGQNSDDTGDAAPQRGEDDTT